jgi:predicted aldo/keto reductase-like oxidoreductase
VGINIAEVTKYLDIATVDSSAVNKGIGQHYTALSAHGSDCIQCGDCEKKCPFGVGIIENMKNAVKVFGK